MAKVLYETQALRFVVEYTYIPSSDVVTLRGDKPEEDDWVPDRAFDHLQDAVDYAKGKAREQTHQRYRVVDTKNEEN